MTAASLKPYQSEPGAAPPGMDRRCHASSDRTLPPISWTLPTPLLLFAGAVALWPLASVVRRPTSPPRLVAETFGTTLAVIALGWLGWSVRWVLAQRW
jgi:hypothetical protein